MPILKSNCNVYGKTVTADDFGGVSISPVISKVFEHCVLDRYGAFFGSSDNQFGFKKNLGCIGADFRFEVPGQSSVGLIRRRKGSVVGRGTMTSAKHEPIMGFL